MLPRIAVLYHNAAVCVVGAWLSIHRFVALMGKSSSRWAAGSVKVALQPGGKPKTAFKAVASFLHAHPIEVWWIRVRIRVRGRVRVRVRVRVGVPAYSPTQRGAVGGGWGNIHRSILTPIS